MKVTCAWCQHEGRPATLGERAPLEDPAETHGICRRHTVDLLNRMPSRSFPGIRLLLVVGAKETALYEHLQRELAGVSGVKVMLDRRRGDRAAEHVPHPRPGPLGAADGGSGFGERPLGVGRSKAAGDGPRQALGNAARAPVAALHHQGR